MHDVHVPTPNSQPQQRAATEVRSSSRSLSLRHRPGASPLWGPSIEVIKNGSGRSGVGGGGEATGARLDFGTAPDQDLAILLIDPDGVCSNLTIEHLELASSTLPTMTVCHGRRHE